MPDPIPPFDGDAGGAHVDTVAGGNRGAGDSPYVDEGLQPGGGAGDERTMLELLVDDLASDEQVGEIGPLVLQRNNAYSVVYAKITDGEVIDKARKTAKDRKKADGIDGPKFAALICVSACLRIYRNGELLVDDDDRPLKFNHRMLLQAFNAATAAECARRFYGSDAELDAVARKVMTDSGWGEDAIEADVVDPPSSGSRG